MSIYSRTDLALESRELWDKNSADTSALQGVKVSTSLIKNLELTEIEILNQHGASALNKPVGHYISLELDSPFYRAGELFSSACFALKEAFIKLIPENASSYLIAALGNPDVTPDALGPIAASNILVTHHLIKSHPEDFSSFADTSLLRPGVLGTSGIESAVQIKNTVKAYRPDCLIVIDALAGLELKRLCRCFQVSDTGICPGAGVGNNRSEISPSELGIPVISVGVPTVIDAEAISDNEKLKSFFVTPRDIDSAVRTAAKLIAYSINMALHPNLSINDIDMLLG